MEPAVNELGCADEAELDDPSMNSCIRIRGFGSVDIGTSGSG